jgi:hypothetical protein
MRSRLASLAVLFSACATSEEITLRIVSPVYIVQRSIVPRHEFRPAVIRELAVRFVRMSAGVPFATLYIDTDVDQYGRYSNKGLDSLTYENWVHRLTSALAGGELPIPNIAQVDVIDREAVLRTRLNNRVSREVLTRVDPRLVSVKGTRFEILHFTAAPNETAVPGTLNINCSECISFLTVFARTNGSISRSGACDLASALKHLAPGLSISVSVRRDPYFVTSGDFPMLYAFDDEHAIPSKAEYQRGPEAGCVVDSRSSTDGQASGGRDDPGA